MIFAETLRALAPLFILMMLGVALRRSGALRPEHVPLLNGLVVNVTLPALVIHSLSTAPSVPKQALWLPLMMAIGEYVTMSVAWGLTRTFRLTSTRAGALILTGTFGNTGFLGYPIVLALFPHQFTANILVDQIGMGIVLYTSAPVLGALLAPQSSLSPLSGGEGPGERSLAPPPVAGVTPPRSIANAPTPSTLPQTHAHRSSSLQGGVSTRTQALQNIAAFFRSTLFLAMLGGIVIRLIPWPDAVRHSAALAPIGSVVAQCLTYLGQGTVPLIMLSMGASLRPAAIHTGVRPMLIACVLKLAFIPLIVWQLLRLVGVHGDLLTVGVMLAAMPSGVMASVLGQHNGFDADYGVGVVFVATVLSAIALPLWVMLAR